MKTTTTAKRITFSKDGNEITTIATAKGFEFIQSVEKGNKIALELQNEIKQIVKNKIDKKNNYARRLAMVAKVIENSQPKSFLSALRTLRMAF